MAQSAVTTRAPAANDGVMPFDTAIDDESAPLAMISLAPEDATPMEKCVMVAPDAPQVANVVVPALATCVGAVPLTVQPPADRARRGQEPQRLHREVPLLQAA